MPLADAANHCTTFWCNYSSVQFDPYHLLAELGFSVIFELIQLFAIVVLWKILWKSILKPLLINEVHAEIDLEHGVHHEGPRKNRRADSRPKSRMGQKS